MVYIFLRSPFCRCTAPWRRSTRGCTRRAATSARSRLPDLRYVTLPLSLPGVIAGTLLTFIPAVGDYINAYMLGSPNTMVIGQSSRTRRCVTSGYPVASAMGVVLTVGTVW